MEEKDLILDEELEALNRELREISNAEKCKFVLWIGNKRLIKRKPFDAYIEQAYFI